MATAAPQAKIALGAGAVIILASLLPWTSAKGQFGFVPYEVPVILRFLSVLIGAVVVAGVFALQLPQYRQQATVSGLAASGAGLLLYLVLMIHGWTGRREGISILSTRITWNPGAGLILAFLAAAVAAGCYAVIVRARPPAGRYPPPPVQ